MKYTIHRKDSESAISVTMNKLPTHPNTTQDDANKRWRLNEYYITI